MVRAQKIVSLNGSPRSPSRTEALVRAIGHGIEAATGAAWRHISLVDIAPLVLPVLTRDRLSEAGEAVIADIESADILVIGTPVYRASFSGALKHVFDLVDYRALRGRIAVLAATGGNRHHGLVTEHQLRPLASFFGMFTVPTAIFAEEADFEGYAIRNPAIHERIESVTREIRFLTGHVAAPAFVEEI